DAFSGGRFDPAAIKDFLAYAYSNWQPQPQHVLLVGDANLDYRNYFETDKKNIVPVYLSHTPELGLTPSDNWYACVEGNDRIPDVYIGRLPGADADTVTDMVHKIVRYETSETAASEQALFVADDDEPAFENLNSELAGYLPASFTPHFVNARDYEPASAATDDIVSKIDAGMLMATYTGHGDVRRWGVEPGGGGDFILEPSDIDHFNNTGNPPFVLALNCLNGYFGQSHHYSLAEQWVMPARGGAIAGFAPSGLSHQWEHARLSKSLFSGLFLERQNNLGALTTGAKIDSYYQGASDKVFISFNLIGDPATNLAVFRDDTQQVSAFTVTAETGAGGTISPSGIVPVFDGKDETFSIQAASGYTIADVEVDGQSQGAVSQYRFSDVTEDHTISAAFSKKQESSSGGGGGCFIGMFLK
ncbi:MAG: C25 family cysteine peptidase, partial [Thermodesulfobacteriota bacterium]